jgi:hypothetical protein
LHQQIAFDKIQFKKGCLKETTGIDDFQTVIGTTV